MTAQEILIRIKSLGQESYKRVIMKHGIQEPVYGVKIEELKKIAKDIRNGYELSLILYDTGVYDTMYFAGLVTEPEKMTEADLQHWAELANAPVLRESTVAWVAAESCYGMKKAMQWIACGNNELQSTGWATLADIVAIKDDSELDMALLATLLAQVVRSIHQSGNRVKLMMNGFVIAVGIHVKPLHEAAKLAARQIGKVTADMGDTACKIPAALDYIEKAEKKNTIGKKKKSARCL
jgi:hypothetical protein